MVEFSSLKTSEQSKILRDFLKKQRFLKGRLEAEKDRRGIGNIEQQRIISKFQTHIDIMSIAMQDLEPIERYVIEQSYYECFKHKDIAKRLNGDIKIIGKISSNALKKIRINLCNMSIGIELDNKDKKGTT